MPGHTLQAAFSQEKDEILLSFALEGKEFFIKAIQTPRFSSLHFPQSFHRARQNSVDLFPSLIGQKVERVVVQEQERSFYLQFTHGFVLLFKLFGNRSNLVLFRNGIAQEIFHKKLTKDLELNYQQMGNQLALTEEAFLQQPDNLRKLIPTLGDLPLAYLQAQGYDQKEPSQKWAAVQQLLQELDSPRFYMITFNKQLRLSLLPLGQIEETFSNPMEALNAFVPAFRSQEYYQVHYAATHKALRKKVDGAQKIWMQVQDTLENWQHGTPYSQTADVIMANLTNITSGAKEATLYDFYQDKERVIKLHPTESPQKTAERLYRKAKNQNIELQLLQERASRKEAEVEQLTVQLNALEQAETSTQLRDFLKKYTKETAYASAPDLPFYAFELATFKIWVGKNAKANDKLTLHHTHKDDLWLHAKDVPGSHVVIKQQSGKPFPEQVIEAAAQLAAYYSKRKQDTLCPVLYTPKKYVRKPKGAAPGSVKVEREKVILVKPGNPFKAY